MSCEMYTPAGDAGIMLLMNENLAIGKVMSSLGKFAILDLYSTYSSSFYFDQNIAYTYE